jgi:hypothetical protein
VGAFEVSQLACVGDEVRTTKGERMRVRAIVPTERVEEFPTTRASGSSSSNRWTNSPRFAETRAKNRQPQPETWPSDAHPLRLASEKGGAPAAAKGRERAAADALA